GAAAGRNATEPSMTSATGRFCSARAAATASSDIRPASARRMGTVLLVFIPDGILGPRARRAQGQIGAAGDFLVAAGRAGGYSAGNGSRCEGHGDATMAALVWVPAGVRRG